MSSLKQKNKKNELDDLDSTIIPENVIYLSRVVRVILFSLILIFIISVDFDSGITSNCGQKYKKDLNINDIEYGLLISVVTIGKVLGTLFYMFLFSYDHRKLYMVSSSIVCGLSQIGFVLSNNFYYIVFIRLIKAMSLTFSLIYMPVWIDQFGIKKYKTIFSTISSMAGANGRLIGCYIGSIMFKGDWLKAVIFSGSFLLVLSLLFFIIPQKYYSAKYMFVSFEKLKEKKIEEKLVLTKTEEDKNKKSNNKNESNIFKVSSFFIDEKHLKKKTLLNKQKENTTEQNTFSLKLSQTIFNGYFLFSSLSRTSLFALFSTIHPFLKMYVFGALNFKDEKTFLYYYSVVSLFAPPLGSIIGGSICHKFLGGYESKRSVVILIIFGLLGAIFITIVRITTDVFILFVGIFGYFFSASALIPTISGYTVHSITIQSVKGFGSSLDSLIGTVLGKLPFPVIYGLINQYTKTKSLGWKYTLCIFYLGYGFMLLASFFKFKSGIKKDKNKKEKELSEFINDYNEIEKPVNNLSTPKPIPKINRKEIEKKDFIINEDDYSETENEKEQKLIDHTNN